MAETRDRRHLLALVLVASVASACDDKPTETRPVAAEADGGEAQLKGVDPELAEAVAKAKKNEGDPKGPKDENGPPEDGVFEPGKADAQLKRGAPPKIALGDAGKEPRTSLVPTLAPGWKETGSIEISLKMGRNALPELSFGLAFEALKPKEGVAGQPMVAKVEKVGFTSDQGAQGKEMAGQLGKMRGSRIEFRIVEGGVGIDYGYSLAKGADPSLEMVLRSVGEALETATLGYPKEAVGAGGYWLVTTRGLVNGTEVVSYRLVKLEKVEGSTLTLNVNTKRYAVTSKLDLPGVPPGSELAQFQSTVDGTLTAEKNSPIAGSGSTKQQFLAGLIQPSNPQQPMGVQASSDTTFKFGKK